MNSFILLLASAVGATRPDHALFPPTIRGQSFSASTSCTEQHAQLCSAAFDLNSERAMEPITLPGVEGTATFVKTGDIDAFWLRDAAEQCAVYLASARHKPLTAALERQLTGALKSATFFVRQDPYAHAFRREKDAADGWVFSHEYEADSLAFFLRFALDVSEVERLVAADEGLFLPEGPLHQAVRTAVSTLRTETEHERNSTYRTSGSGPPAPSKPTGLIWSANRPSDDQMEFSYSIPTNVFAAVQLDRLARAMELSSAPCDASQAGAAHTAAAEPSTHSNRARLCWGDQALGAEADALVASIRKGLSAFGTTSTTESTSTRRYCFEVDGLSSCSTMDDANVPSLLSLPLLDPHHLVTEAPLVLATRRDILSRANAFYFCGALGCGIGSPHVTGPCTEGPGSPFAWPCQSKGYIWPMSLIVQRATSTDADERETTLAMLLAHAAAANGTLHESFSADNAAAVSRPFFGWVNALFATHACDECTTKLKMMRANRVR